jgi:hypothetical protein
MRTRLYLACACIPLAGCTTMSLERNTVRQSQSITDLRYREVLSNLAMLSANPATLPSFSSIYAGTADVTDSIAGSPAATLMRIGLMPFGTTTVFGPVSADVNFSRTLKENWTLDPVVVPEKLRALRCACWWELSGPEQAVSDFNVHLTRYRPADPGTGFPGDPRGFYFDVADRLAKIPPGWLHTGGRCDVPKDACYRANCGDHYVWVMSDGVQCLSDFTLALQAIARVAIGSVYYPLPPTRSVNTKISIPNPSNPNQPYSAQVTVNVDDRGQLVPGPGLTAIPLKVRIDNVGVFAELHSQIVAAKSP